MDQSTNRPVEGCVLIGEMTQAIVVTNVAGQADVSIFQATENIQVRSLGHETIVLSWDQLRSLGFQIVLVPSVLALDEVVVAGTRWRQTSGTVPSKIISITAREVALQNPQTAADLLGISGKVFIQKSQQGGGSPMIRGFATNRLIYTVDGVRMNTAIFRGGNIQQVINLDPFATEKTEVLFGPGSVIYGSDAIGGVMSFQTLTPQLSLTDKELVTGKAVTRYASANSENTVHFDVNVGWKKWAFATSFSAWDFDHLRQGSHGPDDYVKPVFAQRLDSMDVVVTQDDPLLQIPSAYSQMNLMQKVRFQPNAHWDFQYGFHYSATSPYGRYDRHNRYRNGTLRYAEWNYGPQQWMMNGLHITHKGATPLYDRMVLRLAQQYFEESRIDRALNAVERTTNTEQVDAYSVNADFTKHHGTSHRLYYGLEYVLNDVYSTGSLTDIATGDVQIGPSRYPNATWASMAIYLNEEWRLSKRTTLQAGIRYNQFLLQADFTNNLDFYPFPFTEASIHAGALTGSLGGVFRWSDSWVVKANLGTAFRSPNVDDIGKVFDSEPGAVTVPNPQLKAEYAYNIDIGMAKIFGKRLKVDVTAYYTDLQQALVRRNFQLNGLESILYGGQMSRIQALQNAAKAYVYGVQVGVEVKLPAGFSLITDVNYQVGEEEWDDGTTSPSRHAAPFFGVTKLRYQKNDLVVECNVAHQAKRSFEDLPQEERAKDEIYAKDVNGNNYAPAWHTLNWKVIYQITDHFTLSGGVENLTDQRYRPYSSGISGAGRNVILSLQAIF
ncbi:MAG: TonB-dependent receptor [Saprospiraceae bacterium]